MLWIVHNTNEIMIILRAMCVLPYSPHSVCIRTMVVLCPSLSSEFLAPNTNIDIYPTFIFPCNISTNVRLSLSTWWIEPRYCLIIHNAKHMTIPSSNVLLPPTWRIEVRICILFLQSVNITNLQELCQVIVYLLQN